MKCTNINFVKVLQNISKAYIKASPDDKEVWIESFNRMCDDLLDIDSLELKVKMILVVTKGVSF